MSSPKTEYIKDSFMVAQKQNKGNKTPQQGSISVASKIPPLFAYNHLYEILCIITVPLHTS